MVNFIGVSDKYGQKFLINLNHVVNIKAQLPRDGEGCVVYMRDGYNLVISESYDQIVAGIERFNRG